MTITGTPEALWSNYRKNRDPQAREALILRYTPLVRYATDRVVRKLPTVFDGQDAASQGILGLMEAIERFDPQRGVKFESYALYRIRGSLVDALRSLDGTSRGVRQKRRAIAEATAFLQQELGREPKEAEVARQANMDVLEYRKTFREVSRTTLSLDEIISSSEDGQPLRIADVLSDLGTPDPLQTVEAKENRAELRRALEHLEESERLVISRRYYHQQTLREIGASLGVSESRVSQIHTAALRRLRKILQDQEEDGSPPLAA